MSSVLIFTENYASLVAVMVALGVAKGLRTVYWVLVIPDYVPIERLPAASGLMSVTNGIVFMCLGPLVGKHEYSENTPRSPRLLTFKSPPTAVVEGLIGGDTPSSRDLEQ